MSNPQLILQSERLAFTTWSPDHIDDVVALHSDIEVTRFLSGRVEDASDAKRRMGEWAKDFEKYGWCKFRVFTKADGKFVGRAGFGLEEGEPEIGYALSQSEWGKGYAVEAALALRDWIFRSTEHQSFIGFASAANLPSNHILKKIGMQFTNTRYDDSGKEVSFYKLTKEQWHG